MVDTTTCLYSMRQQLAGYGLAGLLAYGALNTLYYSVAFVVYWTLVVQPERGAQSSTPRARPTPHRPQAWACAPSSHALQRQWPSRGQGAK